MEPELVEQKILNEIRQFKEELRTHFEENGLL
jgi:hypothetical protein